MLAILPDPECVERNVVAAAELSLLQPTVLLLPDQAATTGGFGLSGADEDYFLREKCREEIIRQQRN